MSRNNVKVDTVVLMNEKTLKALEEQIIVGASNCDDPFGYIMYYQKMEFEIDNSISDGYIEKWDKDKYELYKGKHGL
ncbi:hypothetical protein Q7A53_05940 [Halobacillus rhizosphaerae]|uniref:hypothetical protein n=1 Tax=Halobacillus rhizosphaerae TaxID=3064889 RepID=UPI00398BA475